MNLELQRARKLERFCLSRRGIDQEFLCLLGVDDAMKEEAILAGRMTKEEYARYSQEQLPDVVEG